MRSSGKSPHDEGEPPAPLRSEAFHGLAGKIVRAIEPHTEADPAALLVQLLTASGFVVGRCAYCMADGAKHFPNLFVLVVGETSKSRKGTSWSRIRSLFEGLCDWPSDRVRNGLSTGEGLVSAVSSTQPDTRLLVFEGEFGSVLRVMERYGSKLSAVLRSAWDGTDLNIMTKSGALSASGQHISLIGQITAEELLTRIDNADLWNGFANRFLFVYARRAQLLPWGGSVDDSVLQPLLARLDDVITWAETLNGRLITWHSDAAREWEREYPRLAVPTPGLLGSVVSRAEAQVLRLSLIFALLDKSEVIRFEHVRAAIAIWDYCEASAQWIFGGRLSDPVADETLKLLRLNLLQGVTRTTISELFQHHRSKREIDRALSLLEQLNLARKMIEPTAGRPIERWFAVPQKCEVSEESDLTPSKNRGANLLKFSDDEELEFAPFEE